MRLQMAMTRKKEIGSDEKSCNGPEQPTLVLDVIRSILERLSLADFHRARCVSSEWYYASRSCTRVTNPWLIFFPTGYSHHELKEDSCKLFDPREKKSYIVRDVGFDFGSSHCLASCGSWFLMIMFSRITHNLHLVNLFTREMIPLPSLESIDGSEIISLKMGSYTYYATLRYNDKDKGKYKACRKFSYLLSSIRVHKAVVWVDEKSTDYLVVWSHENFLAYQKGGDNNNEKSWKVFEPLENDGCVDMVLKERKLYLLRKSGVVTVFDFSGADSPKESASFPPPRSLSHFSTNCENLVVTLSGQVLIVSSGWRHLFTLYKLDPKSSEWILVEAIGDDETLLLDLGSTVAAKGGLVENCIYYSKDEYCRDRRLNWWNNDDDKSIYVYNIKTSKVFKPCEHLTASSPTHFRSSRWFFPTFGLNLLL